MLAWSVDTQRRSELLSGLPLASLRAPCAGKGGKLEVLLLSLLSLAYAVGGLGQTHGAKALVITLPGRSKPSRLFQPCTLEKDTSPRPYTGRSETAPQGCTNTINTKHSDQITLLEAVCETCLQNSSHHHTQCLGQPGDWTTEMQIPETALHLRAHHSSAYCLRSIKHFHRLWHWSLPHSFSTECRLPQQALATYSSSPTTMPVILTWSNINTFEFTTHPSAGVSITSRKTSMLPANGSVRPTQADLAAASVRLQRATQLANDSTADSLLGVPTAFNEPSLRARINPGTGAALSQSHMFLDGTAPIRTRFLLRFSGIAQSSTSRIPANVQPPGD